jgi:hypothetical protein
MKADALRVGALLALMSLWSAAAGAWCIAPPPPEALVKSASVIVVSF